MVDPRSPSLVNLLYWETRHQHLSVTRSWCLHYHYDLKNCPPTSLHYEFMMQKQRESLGTQFTGSYATSAKATQGKQCREFL